MIAYDLFREHKKLEDTPYTVFKFIVWTNIPYAIIGKIIQEEPASKSDWKLQVSDECANRFAYLAANDSAHNETICRMIDLKAGPPFWFAVKVWAVMLTALGICVPYWIGQALCGSLKKLFTRKPTP